MGYGLISKENVIVDFVALVDGLKHNLLSISQLCEKGNEVLFTKEPCIISKHMIPNNLSIFMSPGYDGINGNR